MTAVLNEDCARRRYLASVLCLLMYRYVEPQAKACLNENNCHLSTSSYWYLNCYLHCALALRTRTASFALRTRTASFALRTRTAHSHRVIRTAHSHCALVPRHSHCVIRTAHSYRVIRTAHSYRVIRTAHSENLRFPSFTGFALWKKSNIIFLTCKHDENLCLIFSAVLIAFVDIISFKSYNRQYFHIY